VRCTTATRTGTPGSIAVKATRRAADADSHDSDDSDAERDAARLRAEAERAEAERRERRKVITLNKLGAAAIEVRRQFVTTLLSRKTLPKGAATFLADCLARDSYMLTQHNRDDVDAELLGIDRAAVPTAVSELPAGSDNRALVIALALVLGSLEARSGKMTCDGDPLSSDAR
jgi:ParB family chromosome partitioning protein